MRGRLIVSIHRLDHHSTVKTRDESTDGSLLLKKTIPDTPLTDGVSALQGGHLYSIINFSCCLESRTWAPISKVVSI